MSAFQKKTLIGVYHITNVKIYYGTLLLHISFILHWPPFRFFQLSTLLHLTFFHLIHCTMRFYFFKSQKELINIYRKLYQLIHLFKSEYLLNALYCQMLSRCQDYSGEQNIKVSALVSPQFYWNEIDQRKCIHRRRFYFTFTFLLQFQ